MGGIEIRRRNGLDGPEGEGSPEAAIQLNAAQGGDEGPDGEYPREGARHGDGELLDILIQHFYTNSFVNKFFEKDFDFKIKFFLRMPLSNQPRA